MEVAVEGVLGLEEEDVLTTTFIGTSLALSDRPRIKDL